jgi:isochorismate synthase
LFVLPREQWVKEDGRTFHVAVEPGASRVKTDQTVPIYGRCDAANDVDGVKGSAGDEPAPHWLARTRAALAQIEEGSLQKIVVARRESRVLNGDIDVIGVLERLRAARPSCYTFCFAVGGSMFIGSSPEMLLSVRGGNVAADALAGTVARGKTPLEDQANAEQLAGSAKDRREHDAVVEGIRRTLAPFTTSLIAGAEPEVRAFPEGFHLRTRIGGALASPASVLDLLAAVHPTPAVCGVPRERAHAVLDRLEGDRGWYTGGVGWLSSVGEGLFAVALRAGLLTSGRLTTWAGAGLVAGSNAERELAETELKMRALLSALEDDAA